MAALRSRCRALAVPTALRTWRSGSTRRAVGVRSDGNGTIAVLCSGARQPGSEDQADNRQADARGSGGIGAVAHGGLAGDIPR